MIIKRIASEPGFLPTLADATRDLDVGFVVSNAGAGSPRRFLDKGPWQVALQPPPDDCTTGRMAEPEEIGEVALFLSLAILNAQQATQLKDDMHFQHIWYRCIESAKPLAF